MELAAGGGGATRRRGGSSRSLLCRGAVVSEVARRHEISPQRLFAWRKAARAGQLALPAAETAAMFVPVMLAARKPAAAQPSRPSITIETAGVVVRAECGVDGGTRAGGDTGQS